MTLILTPLSCGNCSSTDLDEINRARPTDFEGVIVHRCSQCGSQWALAMRLVQMTKATGTTKHGTYEGVRWHRTNGVPMCDECRDHGRRIERKRRQLARSNP